MEIDPISKEVIDNKFLINMQGFSFDINNIYDWFKYSENWINPVTNIRFSNCDIVKYLEKLIELGKIPDILNDHRYCSDCQYSAYNYSKYLNYYQYLSFIREYEKNIEKYYLNGTALAGSSLIENWCINKNTLRRLFQNKDKFNSILTIIEKKANDVYKLVYYRYNKNKNKYILQGYSTFKRVD